MVIYVDAPNYDIDGVYNGLSLTVYFNNDKNEIHPDIQQLQKVLAVLEQMFEISKVTHTSSLEELLGDLDK